MRTGIYRDADTTKEQQEFDDYVMGAIVQAMCKNSYRIRVNKYTVPQIQRLANAYGVKVTAEVGVGNEYFLRLTDVREGR